MDIEKLKSKAGKEVDGSMPLLKQVSRFIYDNPELAFEERKSSGKLADILEEQPSSHRISTESAQTKSTYA